MPRSYRCDYCGRVFAFTGENVKKHNLSKQHLKLKEDYYKQFETVEAQTVKTIGDHVEEWLHKRWPLSEHLSGDAVAVPLSLIAHGVDLDDPPLNTWGWRSPD